MNTAAIGTKISLLCCALAALTVILGVVSIRNARRMNGEVQSIAEGTLPGIESLGLIQGFKKEQKGKILEHIIASSPAEKSKREAAIADLDRQIQAETASYEKTIQSAKDRELFEKIGPTQQRFDRAVAAILPLSRALKTTEAMEIWNGEARAASTERARAFSDLSDYRRSSAKKSGSSAIALGESASFWSLVILAIAILAGALLAFFVVRGVNRVLTRAVTELSEGASQVSSASRHVSASSQSLAQGASEQAASLVQTSASSAEMTTATRKNSESSQQAAVFMNDVTRSVTNANFTLAEMTTSMGEIGASSGKISRIIKVIEDIAFQTNILALNAAVEAARAGEAGMGFAVVAGEVRNLAQRSAQAAKDTASLIEDSIVKSNAASKKLDDVAISIHSITQGTGKVKRLVDQVETSSKEQAQGIEQISKAVAQMDEVTQRSAATAEETASASEELSAQAQALLGIVEELKTLAGTRPGTRT